jgi:hypothetical protein
MSWYTKLQEIPRVIEATRAAQRAAAPLAARRKNLHALLQYCHDYAGAMTEALKKDLRKHPFESQLTEIEMTRNGLLTIVHSNGRLHVKLI